MMDEFSSDGHSSTSLREEERTAWLLNSLTDRKAAEASAALFYWVRAARYEPTPGERELLMECERRASRGAGIAALGGGLAGSLLSRSLKMPTPQRIVLGMTGALVGHGLATFRSHAPSLAMLLQHGAEARSSGDSSPLAEQAERILQLGGRQAVRTIHRNLAASLSQQQGGQQQGGPRELRPDLLRRRRSGGRAEAREPGERRRLRAGAVCARLCSRGG
eukprot:CAMPEP_0202785120 /NCGR_PEP_ID=MMETSP1388-20130828/67688_1 /ASSEMBLY_ACC=CAM_ASM_000864 /TAXON_ID=37098 /ORGANISM="Isochrysis sp, Strain CCMP1244" /LENGTH=219 /DNA_ID=CAMNT_0049454647 /DNA_START=35 /DNA_END=691 /DNA_ORIENTATION=+